MMQVDDMDFRVWAAYVEGESRLGQYEEGKNIIIIIHKLMITIIISVKSRQQIINIAGKMFVINYIVIIV
jgi:hypothetical protein